MGVPLTGHRDDSRYEPDVQNLQIIIGNCTKFMCFVFYQENQTFGNHLKAGGSRETFISKATQKLILIFRYDIMVATINFILIFAIKHLMHQTRDSCHSVRDIYGIVVVNVMIVLVLILDMLMDFQP